LPTPPPKLNTDVDGKELIKKWKTESGKKLFGANNSIKEY
jgi:hypothetical protein